jgi:S1-C subfamily serine protease
MIMPDPSPENPFLKQPNTPPNPEPTRNVFYASGQAPAPSVATERLDRIKRTASLGSRIVGFFKFLGMVIILALLLVTGLFTFLLIFPDSPVSQFAVNQTPLKDYIRLPSKSNSSASSSDSKPVNDLLGLNTNSDPQPYAFAKPGSAKTTDQVVEDVLPSVLSLSVRAPTNSQNLYSTVAGTGYVVSAEGYVVTNKHVIAQKCQPGSGQIQLSATNSKNQVFDLQLLSVDPIYDIALLKIKNPPADLKVIDFADSSTLKLGQDVIAIGNALGQLQNTVTRGIISGLDRNLSTSLVDECTGRPAFTEGLIQTDAAINRGNSGGPLFNAAGQLIGMNTYGTEGAENVGLAIPSKAILTALNSYTKNQIIARPRLGVFSQPISPLIKSQSPWLPVDYGEILLSNNGEEAVASNSAASRAGLKEGDIIVEVNGQKLSYNLQDTTSPLRKMLLNFNAGDTIEVTYLKAKSKTGESFTYEDQSVKVQILLDKNTFDLPKTATT